MTQMNLYLRNENGLMENRLVVAKEEGEGTDELGIWG